MKRYESRSCTFAVPDDWDVCPPYAFAGPGEEEERLTAQVLEQWLPEAPLLAVQVQEQKELLPELYDSFELLEEGPHRLEGVGEGYFLTFRFLHENEHVVRARSTYLTHGPLTCQLLLLGPDKMDRDRGRLFEDISRTFSLRNAEFLSRAGKALLTSEVLRAPQPSVVKAWPGPWRKFPRVCVSLPLPSGWEVMDENGDVLFRQKSAEIRLHRALGDHSEANTWLAARMEHLQTAGHSFLGSENGELENGVPYIALLYEERAGARTWSTSVVTRSLDLFLKGQQALVWMLKAPEPVFPNHLSLFESLVISATFLPPMEWETKPEEPWIEYVLKGPWEPQGPGLYMNAHDEPTILHLTREESTTSLDQLQPLISESLRDDVNLADGFSEKSLRGAWRKHEAFHYSIDGVEQESGDDVSIRSVWLTADRLLYSIFIRGTSPEVTESLSRDLLESFQPSLPR